ncbi:IS3 family transposase [Parageobacillus thermoglucosidasius]|uniref:IS3 family transposase n=1 Tax=Parageobacillus thermoglucosidasius TaxID=1426 RepID=A0AB38QWV4_PARTM|nr:IS3 family transposase [Parageobacillus thermoglucosidasius]
MAKELGLAYNTLHRWVKEYKESNGTKLVIQALQRALNNEKPTGRVTHHSDRGSQYASNDYQQLLQEHHFQFSMSRRGNCYDNACMESFHGLIKKECIYPNRFRTRKEVKQAIFEYIECFYNRKRSHSALEYASPCEFEAAYYAN